MATSESVYGDSTVLAKKFLASMTVLSYAQMERLRQGEKITLRDVELGQTISHRDSGDTRTFTYLFNIAAQEIASHLDEATYLNEDDQLELLWSDVAEIPKTSASYTHWESSSDLTGHQLLSEGMSAKCVVELDHLPNGDETLEVVSFIASSGESGDDVLPSAKKKAGIDAESNADSNDDAEDNAEESTEVGEPTEEPR